MILCNKPSVSRSARFSLNLPVSGFGGLQEVNYRHSFCWTEDQENLKFLKEFEVEESKTYEEVVENILKLENSIGLYEEEISQDLKVLLESLKEIFCTENFRLTDLAMELQKPFQVVVNMRFGLTVVKKMLKKKNLESLNGSIKLIKDLLKKIYFKLDIQDDFENLSDLEEKLVYKYCVPLYDFPVSLPMTLNLKKPNLASEVNYLLDSPKIISRTECQMRKLLNSKNLTEKIKNQIKVESSQIKKNNNNNNNNNNNSNSNNNNNNNSNNFNKNQIFEMILLTDTLLICQKFGNGKEEKLVLKYPPLPLELVRTRDVETKVGMAANLIEFMMSSKEFNELVNFLTKEQFETLEGQGLKKKKDGEEIIDYVYENFIKTKSESNCSAEYQQKFKEFFLEYKLSKFAMVYLEYFEMLDKNAKVKFLNDFENAKQNLINSKDMIRREKFIKNESNQISQQSENNFQLEKDEVLLSADGVIERQYGWMYTNDETKGEEIMSVITNPFLFDKNTNTYKDFTRCFLKLYQNSKTCWLQLLDVVTLRVFLKVSISGIFFFYEENVINSLEEENKTKQKKKKDDDDNKLILEGINWEGKKQTFCCTLRLKEDLMNLKKKIQEKINFQLKTLIKEYTERKKVLVQDDSSSQSLEYHKYKSSIPCCMLGGENKGNVKEVELIIFDYYIPKPEEFETKFVFPRLKIVKKIPEMEGLLVLDCTMELEMKVYLELDKVVLEILKDETVFLYKFYFGSSVEDFNKINIFFLNFQQEKKNCELIKTLITERNRLKKNFFFEEVEQEEEEDKKKNLEDEKKINKIKSIDQEEKIEKDFSIVESKKVTKEKLIKEEETFTLSDALIKNVEDKNLPDNKSMVNLGDLRDLLQYLSVNGISNKNPMEMEKYSKLFSCLENSNLPPSLSASSSNETLRQHQIFTSQPCLEEATNKKYSPLKVSKFVNDLRKIDIFEKKKTNLQKLSRVENYFNELYKK